MAISRIFIGVHYPLDVIAGAMIALAVTSVVIWQRRLFETLFNWVIHICKKPKSTTNSNQLITDIQNKINQTVTAVQEEEKEN